MSVEESGVISSFLFDFIKIDLLLIYRWLCGWLSCKYYSFELFCLNFLLLFEVELEA